MTHKKNSIYATFPGCIFGSFYQMDRGQAVGAYLRDNADFARQGLRNTLVTTGAGIAYSAAKSAVRMAKRTFGDWSNANASKRQRTTASRSFSVRGKQQGKRRRSTSSAVAPVEHKFLDTAISIADISLATTNAGTMNCLNVVPIGTSVSTRIGRFITMQNILIDLTVERENTNAVNPAATAAMDFNFSLSLVYCKDPTSVAGYPLRTDIWTSAFTSAPRNLDHSEEFTVLKEWRAVMKREDKTLWASSGSATIGRNTNEVYRIRKMIKLRNLLTKWTKADTTGSAANMESGALWIIGRSDFSAASSTGDDRTVQGTARLYYKD